jgi:hypothetical protein
MIILIERRPRGPTMAAEREALGLDTSDVDPDFAAETAEVYLTDPAR